VTLIGLRVDATSGRVRILGRDSLDLSGCRRRLASESLSGAQLDAARRGGVLALDPREGVVAFPKPPGWRLPVGHNRVDLSAYAVPGRSRGSRMVVDWWLPGELSSDSPSLSPDDSTIVSMSARSICGSSN